MEIYTIIISIINIVAIIIIPILSVWIAQWLQNKSEQRKDKLQVFRHLMVYREWNYVDEASVNMFNSIPIIFHDNEDVLDKYTIYKESLFISDEELEEKRQEIKNKQYKMLEAMAKSLNYKNININEIDMAYIPKALTTAKEDEEKFKKMQLHLTKAMCNANIKPESSMNMDSKHKE